MGGHLHSFFTHGIAIHALLVDLHSPILRPLLWMCSACCENDGLGSAQNGKGTGQEEGAEEEADKDLERKAV